MNGTPRPRSLACAEASRRNGALSKGPRTALGKLKSSQSSRKHGLFSSTLLTYAVLPASAADLEDLVCHTANGWLDGADQSELAKVAIVQLEEASRRLDKMRAELDRMLVEKRGDSAELGKLMQEIMRVAGYQRRFRGKRDRALRRLMAVPARAATGP